MGTQSSKQTMSRKEQPPSYNDVMVIIDKPGVSAGNPPIRDLNLGTEQPLSAKEFLETKRTFDICRKAEYERAYEIACTDYIRVINYKLRTSLKESYIFIHININNSCNVNNSCEASIKIKAVYSNPELETQIINKVYDYIVDAYKGYNIEKTSSSNYSIGMRIYLPNNTLPFGTKTLS